MTNREREILKLIEENPLISQNELSEKLNITRTSVGVHISKLLKKGQIIGKGYILPHEKNIVVIGGANIDIAGISYDKLQDYDSNPGKVSISLGGVGRNIAENLARLGQEVELITALGTDLYGEEILKKSKEIGIKMNNSLVSSKGGTSTYLSIIDENRDMRIAISSMDINSEIDLKFLEEKLKYINRSKLCILDTNISKESLEFLGEKIQVPIFIDCVSTIKAEKIKGILGKFYAIKANKLEAEKLTGVKFNSVDDLKSMGEYFLRKGIKEVYITLGEKGVYFCNSEESNLYPAIKGNIINTTGAGDAFMAGIAYSFIEGVSPKESCMNGIAAATIAMSSVETISKEMSLEKINKLLFENKESINETK